MLANLLQPWSKDRLKTTDFYTPRVTNPEQEKREKEQQLARENGGDDASH